METVMQDLRYALRILRRSPGFTVVAILALGLGIGATTAIFSIVNAVILKPLPYEDPGQLVQIWMRFTGIGIPNDQNWVSPPEVVDLQQNNSFSELAAIDGTNFNVNLGGVPERIEAAVVSTSFFPLLGVNAQLGRVFLPEEGRAGHQQVALLGDGLWRRRFGADPAVLGRKLIMNGQSYAIVGVLPRGFKYPRDVQMWTPLVFGPADLDPNNRGSHGLWAIARIKPGMSLTKARADMAAVSQRMIEQNPKYPYRQFNFGVLLVPLQEQQIGGIKTALWVMMGAVSLVLLIACGNVANLLLVRASARQREIAVRQALGVSRGRLARQLLTESLVLAAAGGATGMLLAYAGLRGLIAAAATSFPRVAETTVDLGVLGFTVLVSLGTGVLFGLAPVFHVAGSDAHETLKEGGRGSARGGSQRLRGALVVGELALSLALLAGSGLLIRSFLRLLEVDTGFRPEGVLTMSVSLPEQKYAKPEQSWAFYRDLMQRVRQLPGVDAAGAVGGLPLTDTGSSGTATIDTQAVPEKERQPEVDLRPVTPGYFEAMGIGLVRGRYFDARDTAASQPVAIVDETLAGTYWPHQDAIGQRLKIGDGNQPWRVVVGVVRHVRYRTLEAPSRTEFYWPYEQSPYNEGSLSLVIHTRGEPRTLVNAVRREVAAIDPDQAVYAPRTMQEVVAESVARRRLSMFLLAIFAGAALLLAAMGIYGVMSYTVAQRAHELGIRMALGARGTNIVWLVLAQSLWLTGGGLALGLVGALVLTRLLGTLLFQVRATDPVTYLVVAGFLALVALLASFIPAWRAAGVDPAGVLRGE